MNPQPVTLKLNGPDAIVRLEPLTQAHAPGLFVASRDPSVWQWLTVAQPQDESAMRAYIESALANQAKGTDVPFAVIDTRTETVAGTTRYLDIMRDHRALEIGWTWYGVPWQRTRLNSECKLLLMTHAFETLGAVRVQFRTDARNTRSQNAIQRLGAQFEGRFRKNRIIHSGYIRDTMYYSVIEEEWPGVKDRLESFLATRA